MENTQDTVVKNIIFDLSEVIYYGYYGVENEIEKSGIHKKVFLERKQETLDFFFDTMRGKYSEDDYFEMFLKDTNWNVSVNDLKKYFRNNIKKPVKGTKEIIQKLKRKYKLILLSDYLKEWREYLESFDELPMFDYKFFSYQYRKLKQDNGTFQLILDKLKIKPEETLFIDDNEKNVQCAEKIGIKGIIFIDSEQLKKELRNLNLL